MNMFFYAYHLTKKSEINVIDNNIYVSYENKKILSSQQSKGKSKSKRFMSTRKTINSLYITTCWRIDTLKRHCICEICDLLLILLVNWLYYMCEVKSEYGDLLQEILMHLTLWSHFLKVNVKTQYINSQFYLSCRYSTTNVYGNADTTLVQVMRVVWQSVRTVCVPSVVF